jgi:hypothetical protein
MSRALRRRYGHAKITPEQRAALLQQALIDWRSGRAFVANGKGHRYMLRPVSDSGGQWQIVPGRAKTAPWNKVANEEWGPSTDGLYHAARAAYPDAAMSSFERMHHLDPVAYELLQRSGANE